MITGAVAIRVALICPLTGSAGEPKKQYWATSLTGEKSATFRDHALRPAALKMRSVISCG
jgi:hypothetical protein